ncbi:MAG: nucleoside-diphosphate kinase [Chloroflexi bacterium]|nr:nucleoside-diphosphate kinase [Chloroflexota bacterium]
MERTLVLVKPDGMQRALAGEIIARLERRGLKIVGMKLLHMDEKLAKRHYAVHEGKPFFKPLVDYITSSPIIAAVFEGTKAVEVVRNTMGGTNPVQAAMGTIRGDFGLEIGRNLVHGSDSVENAKKEIALFFSPGEIVTYEREIDRWIIES